MTTKPRDLAVALRDDQEIQGPLAVAYLKVLGMGCPRCEDRVRAALQQLGGVSLAEIHLGANLAGVLYDPCQVEESELVEAVAAAGSDGYHHYEGKLLAKCRLK